MHIPLETVGCEYWSRSMSRHRARPNVRRIPDKCDVGGVRPICLRLFRIACLNSDPDVSSDSFTTAPTSPKSLNEVAAPSKARSTQMTGQNANSDANETAKLQMWHRDAEHTKNK
ncbi:hypothetical protein L596_025635 [Steinernema carpocapsae]|uniref:Uncharacterized protein n=1 Tax=Steinernema carpocapsae TaxID=34508 RepID=A0A4U5M8D3_STECR|nr:hypothetical protein L596_025635 [Steinernema carpocapsae]